MDGVAGPAPFDAKAGNLCNVATLYPQYFQVAANADTGIETLSDLQGKGLAVQPKGNTAEFISQQALAVYGLKYSDASRVSYVSHSDAVSLVTDNKGQVFTLGTTVPASTIMDLASARDITIVAITDDKFQTMRKLNPGYTKLVIPAGSYPKQTADVPTIGYASHVIVRCDLDQVVVYKLLKGMIERKAELAAIAKAMATLTPKLMAEDIGVPMHKGATRYYKEVGALQPAAPPATSEVAADADSARHRRTALRDRRGGADVAVPPVGGICRATRRLCALRLAPGLCAGAGLSGHARTGWQGHADRSP